MRQLAIIGVQHHPLLFLPPRSLPFHNSTRGPHRICKGLVAHAGAAVVVVHNVGAHCAAAPHAARTVKGAQRGQRTTQAAWEKKGQRTGLRQWQIAGYSLQAVRHSSTCKPASVSGLPPVPGDVERPRLLLPCSTLPSSSEGETAWAGAQRAASVTGTSGGRESHPASAPQPTTALRLLLPLGTHRGSPSYSWTPSSPPDVPPASAVSSSRMTSERTLA